jgi:hypothetical protein
MWKENPLYIPADVLLKDLKAKRRALNAAEQEMSKQLVYWVKTANQMTANDSKQGRRKFRAIVTLEGDFLQFDY